MKLNKLINEQVPNLVKAVKWNSPFYGTEKQGWFLSFHCYTKYIKVTFFNGSNLNPLPPVAAKDPNIRYFHINETDEIDLDLLAQWIKQASKIPGWIL